ncbi:MAG: hypothetical protein CME98_08660 [Hyphomonas sp.]|nr:hypothetical protein [Hyphomonas sp.]
MCRQCNITRQIKESRRITNELASIKQRLLNLRIDAGLLFDELDIMEDIKVQTMNEMSRTYDKVDYCKTVVRKVINDRL